MIDRLTSNADVILAGAGVIGATAAITLLAGWVWALLLVSAALIAFSLVV